MTRINFRRLGIVLNNNAPKYDRQLFELKASMQEITKRTFYTITKQLDQITNLWELFEKYLKMF
jgi:hypothetical protein